MDLPAALSSPVPEQDPVHGELLDALFPPLAAAEADTSTPALGQGMASHHAEVIFVGRGGHSAWLVRVSDTVHAHTHTHTRMLDSFALYERLSSSLHVVGIHRSCV